MRAQTRRLRKPIYIGTNLKMYKTIRETVDYLTALQARTGDLSREEFTLFVIPSYTALPAAAEVVDRKLIRLGAQNMHWKDTGEFTGEISPLMLKEIGIDLVEIGHSERREHFGESDLEINKKVLSALRHGFVALICVGETQEDKRLQITDERLRQQVKTALHGIEKPAGIWIAYEPVWAIGTRGIPAEPGYADLKHRIIKEVLREIYPESGETIPVLYGGSINMENAEKMAVQPNIDGLFIGRAAWEAGRFNELIRKVLAARRG